MKICLQCNSINGGSYKFCTSCGTARGVTELSKTRETIDTNETIDTVTCTGYYSNNKICTTDQTPLPTISINSYWRYISIPNNTHVIFEYEPSTEIAYNVRIYPNTLEVEKEKNKITVKGGTVPEGDYCLTNQGLILRGEAESICLYGAKISLITEERAKHLMKSVALGAVGALATFGIGLVVGALHASKKYQLIEVRFSEAEFFIAECRPDAYQQLLTAVLTGNQVIGKKDFLDSIKNGQKVDDISKYFHSIKRKKDIEKYVIWAIVTVLIFASVLGGVNNR